VLGPLGNAEIAVFAEWSPLDLWRQGIFGEWNVERVGSTVVELDTWTARSATGTEIATNVAGYIYVYFNTDGSSTWTLELPSAARAYYGTAITRTSGGTEIVSNAFDGSLDLFTNSDGSSTWSTTQVAGPGTAYNGTGFTWPAIVRYPSHGVGQFGGTEIAAVVEP